AAGLTSTLHFPGSRVFSQAAMRAACLRPLGVSSRARSSSPSAASAWRHRINSTVIPPFCSVPALFRLPPWRRQAGKAFQHAADLGRVRLHARFEAVRELCRQFIEAAIAIEPAEQAEGGGGVVERA